MRRSTIQEEIDILQQEGILPKGSFESVEEMHKKSLNEKIKESLEIEKEFLKTLNSQKEA